MFFLTNKGGAMIAMKVLARNISKYREERGLTISGMAEKCGIAKSTLSTLESGGGNPTIETLWAIANTLDVPFGVLVSPPETDKKTSVSIDVTSMPMLTHHVGSSIKLIERTDDDPEIEVYSVEFDTGYYQESKAHPVGVTEKVTVISGTLLVGQFDKPHLLRAGETYSFKADMPHIYQATDTAVKAIIIIEYPVKTTLSGPSVKYLDWPENTSEWEGVNCVLERLLMEVSNGLSSQILRFRKCIESPTNAKVKLRNVVTTIMDTDQQYKWPLIWFVDTDKQRPYLSLLPTHFTNAFKISVRNQHDSLFDNAVALANLAESPYKDTLSEDSILHFLNHKTWILNLLAHEALMQYDKIALPEKIVHQINKLNQQHERINDQSFSSRINVDHYDAYELLHPAYARQVVAVAEDIIENLNVDDVIESIDIGSGPGIPLVMLHELIKKIKTIATEPDDTAFECLINNITKTDSIKPSKLSYLDINDMDSSFSLITSFGSSHYFNTAFMLQKSMRLLKKDGLLCIADKFLNSFNTSCERNISLIKHHSSYILDRIKNIDNFYSYNSLLGDEFALYEIIKREISIALVEAESHLDVQAVNRCRDLYITIKKMNLQKISSSIIGAYLRFFWLEIQSMIAGFDYEVERKTYPSRICELANLVGFKLLKHRKVFSSSCGDEFSSGTHVFTFQKQY